MYWFLNKYEKNPIKKSDIMKRTNITFFLLHKSDDNLDGLQKTCWRGRQASGQLKHI
jgi:hypothetical protein